MANGDIARQRFAEEGDLLRACMRAQGFEYVDVRIDVPRRDFLEAVSIENADRVGYGVTVQSVWIALEIDRANRRIEESSISDQIGSDEFVQALNGGDFVGDDLDHDRSQEHDDSIEAVPDGGCVGEVASELNDRHGPAPADEFVRTSQQVVERLSGEPEYARLVSEWIDCMSEGGFDPADSPLRQAESLRRSAPDAIGLISFEDLPAEGRLDLELVLSRIHGNQILSEALDGEILQAVHDRACRADYISYVRNSLQQWSSPQQD